MLDWFERFGWDFDSLDNGQSLRLHSRLWPGAKPQSICSRLIAENYLHVAAAIGFWHCVRSYDRYHPPE